MVILRATNDNGVKVDLDVLENDAPIKLDISAVENATIGMYLVLLLKHLVYLELIKIMLSLVTYLI
jgi:hypothetical protein